MRLFIALIGAALAAGCGGKVDSAPGDASDAGTFAETAPEGDAGYDPPDGSSDPPDSSYDPPDTAFDTGKITCHAPLPADFACEPPAAKTGAKVCTDAMIEAFLSCFGSDGDEAACRKAQTTYAACNTCILTTWLHGNSVDVAACVRAIDPASTCATAVRCAAECVALKCADCDSEQGTGRTPATSEFDNCAADVIFAGSSTKAKGACYDLAAKDSAVCNADARFAPCFLQAKADLVPFYRGACRDGGDWSKSAQGDGTGG